MIPNVQSLLEARWRIVAYYKGLLAKIKAKVAAAKFTEVRNTYREYNIPRFGIPIMNTIPREPKPTWKKLGKRQNGIPGNRGPYRPS